MGGEGRFTSEAGGFIGALTKFIDLIFAGFLWLVCSIPIVSIGPASTALYYTVVKTIRHERGRVTVSFFSRLRADLKISMACGLICTAYIALGAADIWALNILGMQAGGLLYYLSRLYFLPALLVIPWLFPYISRFENSVSGSLRAAAVLAIRNLWRTLLLALLTGGIVLICWLMPGITPLLPGACCLLQSMLIEPVFRSLSREKDADGNADRWYNE